MSIGRSDQLFNLIKSLDKAEKKNFRLYAQRNSSKSQTKFLLFFDLLDKLKTYDEDKIKEKLPKTTSSQLSNLKRNLSTQILKSLRLIHTQKEIDLQIREQQDFAKILYAKGMFLESLKILDRAKNLANDSSQNFALMEILEFEKLIESRHITRSRKVKNKVENLIQISSKLQKTIANISNLVNLNLKISGLYIKMGHVKNDHDKFIVKEYFELNVQRFNEGKRSFMEQVYLHQAKMWYYYILMDFKKCAQECQAWIQIFQEKKLMIDKDPDLYMRGLHYILITSFYLKDYTTYFKYNEIFERFHKKKSTVFNHTSNFIHFIYGYNAKLNNLFLRGSYDKAELLIPQILKKIKQLTLVLDQHRMIIFYYKIAWIYFAQLKWAKALDYLILIDNLERVHLRDDILCYSNFMTLLCHYELENRNFVESQLVSTRRYFNKTDEINPVVDSILSYISNENKSIEKGDDAVLVKMAQKIEKWSTHTYYKRAFIFFNFTLWIQSKLHQSSIAQEAQNKYSKYTQI